MKDKSKITDAVILNYIIKRAGSPPKTKLQKSVFNKMIETIEERKSDYEEITKKYEENLLKAQRRRDFMDNLLKIVDGEKDAIRRAEDYVNKKNSDDDWHIEDE